MPKFIYTIAISTVVSWYGIYIFIKNNEPDGVITIAVFLLLLFSSLLLFLSIPFYYFFHSRAPSFSNLRYLYRKSVKWASFLSFSTVFMLGLKMFGLASWINTILFIIIMIIVYLRFNSKV